MEIITTVVSGSGRRQAVVTVAGELDIRTVPDVRREPGRRGGGA
ncbi:hypothetical protein ABZ070_34305 [Streptomyces sp. NPDC006283]